MLRIIFLVNKKSELLISAAAQAAQCHIIQIGSNYYDIVPSNHPFGANSYRSCSTLHLDDRNNNSSGGFSGDHTNPGFIIDEGDGGGVFPTNGTLPDLPPSYDDVMRLPSSYPKVAPITSVTVRPSPPPSQSQPEVLPRYPDNVGPAIIEVNNIDHRIDPNNNHQVTHQTPPPCTCNYSHSRSNNNGINVRRQSDTI